MIDENPIDLLVGAKGDVTASRVVVISTCLVRSPDSNKLPTFFRSLQRRRGGATIMIITDGPNTVHAYGEGREANINDRLTRIDDTVGAGDALVGERLAWWAERRLTRGDAHGLPLVAEGPGVALRLLHLCILAKALSLPGHRISRRPAPVGSSDVALNDWSNT